MATFFVTLIIFLAVVAAMSIGVVVSGRRLRGSCGGLGASATNENGEQVCGYCGITLEEQQTTGCGQTEGPMRP